MKIAYENCYCPLSGRTSFTVERGRFVPPAHGCERRDLNGAFVLPAFLDPHSHLLSFAISLLQADASDCRSEKELFALLRRFEKEHGLAPADFLTARDVRPERFADGKFPTRDALDRAFPDRPVLLQHPSGHSGAFNSAALRALGGRACVEGDELVVEGVPQLLGGTVDAANDHRIAMMAAILAARCASPVTIIGAECVSKSYPTFFEDLALLGGTCGKES